MARHITSAATAVCGLVLLLFLGSSIEQWLPGTRDALDTSVFTPPDHRVRVDIRNAGGVPGAARTATERLREIGYDVVDFGNAEQFDLDASVVIDRVGDLETAAQVAQVLGIGRVHQEPDPNLFVDVTVRLGADWADAVQGRAREPRALRWLKELFSRD